MGTTTVRQLQKAIPHTTMYSTTIARYFMCSSSLPSSWSPIALHTTLSSHITQKGRIKPVLLNLKKQFPSAVTSTIFSPRESSCALNCAMSPFLPSFFSCEGTETEKMKSDTPVPGEDSSAEVTAMEHSSLPRRASAACGVWSPPPLSSSSEPSCCLPVEFPQELHGRRPTARWEHSYGIPPEPWERSDGCAGRDQAGPGRVRLRYIDGLNGPGF